MTICVRLDLLKTERDSLRRALFDKELHLRNKCDDVNVPETTGQQKSRFHQVISWNNATHCLCSYLRSI